MRLHFGDLRILFSNISVRSALQASRAISTVPTCVGHNLITTKS